MKPSPSEFSGAIWDKMRSQLDQAQKALPGPWVAAFDADGTLWNNDVGEDFFNFQIKQCSLPNMPADPWKHYTEWKERDRLGAYLWLAQINKGQKLETVLAWAQKALENNEEFCAFPSQIKLIQELQSRHIEIYVISASVEWAVIPPARLLGVPKSNVLGVRTKVVDGIVTDQGEFPITWGPGKLEALAKVCPGKRLIFAVGNTSGDSPLVSCASHVRMAVRSKSNVEGPLWQSEMDLAQIAQEKAWLTHEF
jgi:phosphoserine phosphatase